MADNTILLPGAGGDTIRDVEKAGAKTQVILIDIGGLGAESLFTGAVTQSGAWVITDISGTISLPTGAATAARQDTGNTSLSSIDGKIVAVNTGAVVISSGSVTANAGTNLNTSALALEATLSSLNGKVTTVNTGAVVVASGSITANAGTNLNTSLLALEAGGNLASIAAEDFATQTTLASVLTELGLKTEPADQQHVIVDSGVITASSAATATEDSPTYTEAAAEAFSQDLEGNLRTRAAALVSDAVPSYIEGQVRPLSLTTEGRLRTTVIEAAIWINLFDWSLGANPVTDPDVYSYSPTKSPWPI